MIFGIFGVNEILLLRLTLLSPAGAIGSVIHDPNLDPDVLMVTGSEIPVSFPQAETQTVTHEGTGGQNPGPDCVCLFVCLGGFAVGLFVLFVYLLLFTHPASACRPSADPPGSSLGCGAPGSPDLPVVPAVFPAAL